jgi:molybdopterin converting factor small subunit
MQVTIRLNASLRRYIPSDAEGSPFLLELEDGATVARVMSHLGIPDRQAQMVTVDGDQADVDTVLAEGQELSLFPPLAGGC